MNQHNKALVWEYADTPWFTGFRIVSTSTFLASLLYTLPRFIFLYQMIRYYLSKTTRKPLILTGIASELFPTLVSAVLIAGSDIRAAQVRLSNFFINFSQIVIVFLKLF